MEPRPIRSALISVYHKDGLEPLLGLLTRHGVKLYSTGGTQSHLEKLGYAVTAVESITGYPSILDGRVKTLHPAVFGGILAKREPGHLAELAEHDLPEIDLVIVDLYPFEDTLANTLDEAQIIEKIDIGGISLIRAAAKNYHDVAIIPSQATYTLALRMLEAGDGRLTVDDRRVLAGYAFAESARYDAAISSYFDTQIQDAAIGGGDDARTGAHDNPAGGERGLRSPGTHARFTTEAGPANALRYGENPHQRGTFFGDLGATFTQLHGKELSYNNLVDAEAAHQLIAEFTLADPTAVVIKHTNACGVATRATLGDAWRAALAGDPVSAFGGILAFNRTVDLATAEEMHKLFFEVALAPGYDADALALLRGKKDRRLLQVNSFARGMLQFRSMFGGVLEQEADLRTVTLDDLQVVTAVDPTQAQVTDMLFANICVKHLKSNTIALVRDQQLLAMGCGQTSRVDALKQAIAKAVALGFHLTGSVMASDAFFPFPDCVEIAAAAGVAAVIQPGGSIRDKDSVAAADEAGIAMVTTGVRHFRH